MEISITLKITLKNSSIFFQQLVLFSDRSNQENFGKMAFENAEYGPENYIEPWRWSNNFLSPNLRNLHILSGES